MEGTVGADGDPSADEAADDGSADHASTVDGALVDSGGGGCLDDPVAGSALARLLDGLDAVAGRDTWRLSDADLAALVQAVRSPAADC